MNDNELDESCHMCAKSEAGIVGESLDVSLEGGCETEVKADIIVKEFQSIRIWGQIKDCQDHPVPRVLLKLLRCDCGKLSGVAHTISDCQGFYQFDLCDKSAWGAYKILASRPVSGAERVLDSPCACGKRCESRTCNHCGKSEICKTCAYYDEVAGTCCFENEQ